MDTPDTPTQSALGALYARVCGSSAARDGLWVLAAQVTATAIALGVDVLLFRNLDKPERGTLTAALGLRNVLLYIADMGLALTTVRVGAEYFGKGLLTEANAIFRRAFLTRAALAFLVLVLACLLAPVLCRFPLAATGRPELILAAAAALLGMTVTSWGVDVSQATRSFGRYFLHQVVEAALKAGAVAFILHAALSGMVGKGHVALTAEIVLWAMATASILAGFCSMLLQPAALAAPKGVGEATKKEINAQLKGFNRYAAGIALLTTVGAYVEVFLVQTLVSPGETAVFEGARRLALILPLLGGVMTTVLLPRAAVLDTPAACVAYVKKALLAGVPLALVAAGVLAGVAGIIVPLLWGDRYADSIVPLQWLCLAHAFSIVLAPLMLVFYPLRRERTLLVLQGLGVAAAVGLGAWLIPKHGALGAAWSTLAVRGLLTLLSGGVLWYSLRHAKAGGA